MPGETRPVDVTPVEGEPTVVEGDTDMGPRSGTALRTWHLTAAQDVVAALPTRSSRRLLSRAPELPPISSAHPHEITSRHTWCIQGDATRCRE
jgi:hypothetical protein